MSSAQGTVRNAFCFFWVSFLFIAVAFTAWWRLQPVDAPVAKLPASEFSAARSQEILRQLLADQRPHPVDSSRNRTVADHIVAKLRELGYQPLVRDQVSCSQRAYTCARVRNIVAVREGSPNGKSIAFSSHYDSVGAGPGASDDASSVAAMLDIAGLLEQSPPGRNRIVFLFDDGEEVGLLGARAMADDPVMKGVVAVINAEARGTSGQSTMFETGLASGWLVDAFSRTSRRPLTNSLLNALYKLLPNDTDLSVFKAKGMQGLNFAFGGDVEHYHTPLDNLTHIDPRSLQQQGDNLFGLAKYLQKADLGQSGVAKHLAYTDLMGFTVMRWPVPWGPIMGMVLLAVLVVSLRGIRKHASYSFKDVMRGLASLPLAVIGGVAVAYLATFAMAKLHGMTVPWHSATGANRLVLWSFVALTVTGLLRCVVRRADPVGVWIGLGFAWLICAVLMSIALPGASYLFLLPAVVLVACAFVAPLVATHGGRQRLVWLMMVSALGCFVITLPLVFLLEVITGYNVIFGVLGMGLLLGLAVAWVAPFLCPEHLRPYRYASGILAVVAVLATWFSLRAPAYTPIGPQPVNMIYVQGVNGAARLVADSGGRRPPLPLLEAMGPSTARAKVFSWVPSSFYAASIKSATLPDASLTVLDSESIEKGRRVTVQLNAGPSIMGLMLVVPAKAGLRSVRVENGPSVAYDSSGAGKYQTFICRGESCDGRQFVLDMASTDSMSMTLIRVSAGLPSSLKSIAEKRGKLAVPRNDGDESLVLSNVQI
jgi:hypothetical protein